MHKRSPDQTFQSMYITFCSDLPKATRAFGYLVTKFTKMISDKLNNNSSQQCWREKQRSTDKSVDLNQTQERKVFGKGSRSIANCVSRFTVLEEPK